MQETGVGRCLQFSMEVSVSPHLMLIGPTTNTVLQTVVMTAQAEAGITMFTKSAVLIKVCHLPENITFHCYHQFNHRMIVAPFRPQTSILLVQYSIVILECTRLMNHDDD